MLFPWPARLGFPAVLILIGPMAFAQPMPLQPDPQNAQQIEKQRRAAVVPFVRSATACLAKHAATHTNLVPLYERGPVSELIDFAVPFCRLELQRMSDEHDRYYGQGEDDDFLRDRI